jgi:hypothetical protein
MSVVTTSRWLRCLLVLLGAAELLMAAGSAPVLLAVGVVGGVALIAAGALARFRAWLIALVVIGTVPFAVLAWTAVVPVLLLLTALPVTVPLSRRLPPQAAPRVTTATN